MSTEEASNLSLNVQISGVNKRGSQQGEIPVSLLGNASWKVWHVKMEEEKVGWREQSGEAI